MRPHRSSCLPVVPDSNQSQRELHLMRLRQPIRAHVSASAARRVPAGWRQVPQSRAGWLRTLQKCPRQNGSRGGWGCYPRRGRPLLRRRLRKVSASRVSLRVGLAPRAHELRVPPVLSSARRWPGGLDTRGGDKHPPPHTHTPFPQPLGRWRVVREGPRRRRERAGLGEAEGGVGGAGRAVGRGLGMGGVLRRVGRPVS